MAKSVRCTLFNLPAGSTKAFFNATESERDDDPGNPWEWDKDDSDTCPHNVPLDKWCGACDAESEGI